MNEGRLQDKDYLINTFYWMEKGLWIGGLRVTKLLPLLLPALALGELSQLKMEASFPEAGGKKRCNR